MTKNKEIRFIGYARVSTEEQSLEMQIEALKAAGVPEDHIVTDVKSGANMERDGLKFLLNQTEPNDVVVVWKLDRLGRSALGALKAVEQLEDKNVGLKSLTEPIDTTTSWGKMTMTVLLAFAEMERNMISERTKAGLRVRKAKGMKLGRKHFVLDYPKRLAHFTKLWVQGRIPDGGMSGQEIIDEMNAIDTDAPKVKAAQSYHNWKRNGFEGFKIPDDGE